MGPVTAKKAQENDGTMVTVICTTYNHERYLARALNSFVAQKTNFKFKIFVGEDCSTDNTRQILVEYAKKYPDLIVPFLYRENMGSGAKNSYYLCQQATSPYVAICEGDDYWIDEYKLQKQFDRMEKDLSLRACFTNTVIKNNDGYTDSWLQKKDGDQLIPASYPGFNSSIDVLDAGYYITHAPAHTASMFFRWNYDLQVPPRYFEVMIADHFMMLMQMGEGKIAFLSDKTAVYWRNETGITWQGNDKEKRWRFTRLSWVDFLEELLAYFEKHHNKYARVPMENRLKLETANYLGAVLQAGRDEDFHRFFAEHPTAAKIALTSYLACYRDHRTLVGAFTWPGYLLLTQKRIVRGLFKPVIRLMLKLQPLAKKAKGFGVMIRYWADALVPKQKNLWVFSTFLKKNYMDNCKYLYEYILENHPEIRAVWLTQDQAVIDKLTAENKPVYKMNSKEGKKILRRAAVAFINNNRVTDLESGWGFNARTKVVNLWHGMSPKDERRILELTSFKNIGLHYCDDILAKKEDSLLVKMKKGFKYLRHAHHRELFERYFMVVCPGQERIDNLTDIWNLPRERVLQCGYPRHLPIYNGKADPKAPKIMYAPTYRYDVEQEKELARSCAAAYPAIQKLMEEVNGQFVIRLHPYTWQSFQSIYTDTIGQYDRISFDHTEDLYEILGDFSIVISDCSSIVYDFLITDRPVFFHFPDCEEYMEKDCGSMYNLDEVMPGPRTKNWEESLLVMKEYLNDPQKDLDWRLKVKSYFFTEGVNDKDNSQRIVADVKRRIGLSE